MQKTRRIEYFFRGVIGCAADFRWLEEQIMTVVNHKGKSSIDKKYLKYLHLYFRPSANIAISYLLIVIL